MSVYDKFCLIFGALNLSLVFFCGLYSRILMKLYGMFVNSDPTTQEFLASNNCAWNEPLMKRMLFWSGLVNVAGTALYWIVNPILFPD